MNVNKKTPYLDHSSDHIFKKVIRKLALWLCSKLEKFSFLDRKILKEDLSNFYKVSSTLFRGGQPLGNGFYKLKSLGVKTVVNLRVVDTDFLHTETAGLTHVHISFKPHIPRDIDVIRFLQIIKNPDFSPVYLHCYHGSDRTGMMCAIYRIIFEKWDREKAIEEMVYGGFGFHLFFQHNLITYLRKMDVDSLKEKAGITH